MANNIIKRVWNQGSMTPIEDLQGSAFTNENGGHTFQISGVDSNGEALALSGTVAASFLRPDQTTVGISGSVSGGVASVTLSEECYGIPGRFGLVVFLTSDGKKTAIYSCVGNVARSSTDAVAPGVVADVVDLINEIETAVGTIPASYSALMADIAPTYSSSALYAVGDYAWYDGDLKRCIVPITVGETYTPAHWTSAVVGDDVCALKSALNVLEDQPMQFVDTGILYIKDFGNLENGYINSATGDFVADNTSRLTGFIRVDSKNYYLGSIKLACYEYNENKEYIQGAGWQTNVSLYYYQFNSNTKYVRFAINTSYLNSAYVSVVPPEEDELTMEQLTLTGKMMFSDLKRVCRGYLSVSDGSATVNSDSYRLTDFLPVSYEYKYTGSTKFTVAAYDANKAFIEIFSGSTSVSNFEYELSENTKYIRAVVAQNQVSTGYFTAKRKDDPALKKIAEVESKVYENLYQNKYLAKGETSSISVSTTFSGYIDNSLKAVSYGGSFSVKSYPVVAGKFYSIYSPLYRLVAAYPGAVFSEKNVAANVVADELIVSGPTTKIPIDTMYFALKDGYIWVANTGNYADVTDLTVVEITSFATISSGNYWTGKKAIINGDSIAAGNVGYDGQGQLIKVDTEFGKYAFDKLGITLIENYAVGGATLCSDTVSVQNNLESMDTTADVVLISAGTNDFGHNKPMGTKGDTTASTFYGALYHTMDYLMTTYKGKMIVFCTPLKRGSNNDATNSLGLTLKAYRDAIVEMCEYFGIPCVDMWGASTLNPTYNGTLFYDGLHPLQPGHNIMGEFLAGSIRVHGF